MADEEQLRILCEGVEAWNRWRGEHPGVRPDLSGADLSEADFSKANLRGANLRLTNLTMTEFQGADLSGADLAWTYLEGAGLWKTDLSEARLIGADLSGVDFSRSYIRGADLSEANLWRANLSGVNLVEVDLKLANLWGANLSKANFNGARVGWTAFSNVDLSDVKGLELLQHEGPSTIGIDTLHLSGGRIPEVFLRGCGVPDEFITYMRSLVGRPIEYYSCFISYSSKDQAFADRLHADLQAKGVRCWFAPEDMQIGDKIWERLDQSIRLHDKLLVILSDNSIGSVWVEDEVMTAFEEERKRHQTVLFPVRLDDAVMASGEAWAGLVRQRHIGDFRAWKEHDAYRAGFERLMRDLKAG